MMNKSKIPTVFGLLILITGVITGVFLVQNQNIFKSTASGEGIPKDVRVSNITEGSLTISWVTDKEVAGSLKWGKESSSLSNTEVDGTEKLDYTHTITLTSLTPETTYYFKINSGGAEFDNNGIPWQVKTAPTLSKTSKSELVSGIVLSSTGGPVKNALVYVTVGGGALLSTTTSDSGNWILSISQARIQDLSSFINIDDKTTLIEIGINAGPLGIASAQIYPVAASPVPPITLGQVHDFKNLSATQNSEVPNAEIGLPNESSPASGFKVNPTKNPSQVNKTVTLKSIKDGEIVNTGKPEFFGEGPSGGTVTITVESANPIKEEVKIPSTGSWKWSPPSNLAEGSHKITLTWKDASGIIRSLTRSFIVQAAAGGPAFVSTPSASSTTTPTTTPTPLSKKTPSPTPSPIPTPTISSILETSPTPSTGSAIPTSGSLTPTLFLLVMGLAIITFGYFLWQKSNDLG